MEIELGQIVYSKAGRDKDRCFIVLRFDDEFAYLVDGDLRKADTPKKKKLRHIKVTSCISEFIKNKLEKAGKVTNSEIRKAIAEFNQKL